MRKRHLLFFMLLLSLVTMTACAKDESETLGGDDELKWVEVDVKINPETAQVNEPITFTAEVTYGDEVLTDVKDFSFEIWRSLDENHEEIPVKKAKNGVYQIEKSFEVEGTYYVIAHVTAENMHNMPKKEFVVGTPSEKETGPTKSKYMEDFDLNVDEITE